MTYVALNLELGNWDSVLMEFLGSELTWHVDYALCSTNDLKGSYDSNPHVTLFYSDSEHSEALLYWETFMANRNNLNYFRDTAALTVSDAKIDLFDNPDFLVLKLNLSESNCNLINILQNYNDYFSNKYISAQLSYNPHITITYLNKDTPRHLIEQFSNKFIHKEFKFPIKSIQINSREYTL